MPILLRERPLRRSFAAVDLESSLHRHFPAIEQSDASTEEPTHVVPGAKPEREDVGAFEKEGALFWKRSGNRVRLVDGAA